MLASGEDFWLAWVDMLSIKPAASPLVAALLTSKHKAMIQTNKIERRFTLMNPANIFFAMVTLAI